MRVPILAVLGRSVNVPADLQRRMLRWSLHSCVTPLHRACALTLALSSSPTMHPQNAGCDVRRPHSASDVTQENKPIRRTPKVARRPMSDIRHQPSAVRCISSHTASTSARSVCSAPMDTRTIQRPSSTAGVRYANPDAFTRPTQASVC